MFEMIHDEKHGPEDRKLFALKVVAFFGAVAVAAGIISLFALGYLK